ncbi:MAG: MarR family winged helix-turn-helix transcriptional regulator [Jatrophihabitantaceae bacterium]
MAGVEMSDEELVAQWELIVRAVSRTQLRVVQKIRESGLPAQSFGALHLLLSSTDHRLPMSRLARELSITSGGFTKMADRLGRDGLIDRRSSAGDRRVVYATLTEHGLQLAREMESLYAAALRERVLDVLSPDSLGALAGRIRALAEGDEVAELAEESLTDDEAAAILPRRRLADRDEG